MKALKHLLNPSNNSYPDESYPIFEEFEKQLIALCEAYRVHEFAIYGRFAQTVDAKGNICPPNRYIWCNGEPMVAAEAEYHLGLIAEGQEP